ncbi:MAG: bifunctional tetrahydrofolate synthase/dihydrofolate synthase [Thalassotalea sp.]
MTKPFDQSHSIKQTLNEWLFYLENLHSTEIELGLTRIGQVAKQLNIDLSFAAVITVAGTNGKGTTCAFLENALLAEHKTVAVYSSPHIEKFNERLRINKTDIDDQSLITAFEAIEAARGDISLTYYEYTTLAAFLVLQTVRPDVIILEVGLGGRLDATNLIDADIAVVTTIDLDHQAFLGDTREKIGFEKAGIMRADKFSVVGCLDAPKSVIDHANKIKSRLKCRHIDFHTAEVSMDNSWQWQSDKQNFTHLIQPFIPKANIATALMVLELLNIELTTPKINRLIEQTKVPGRTEIFPLPGNRQLMLDVGHNPQAARYLADFLTQREHRQGKQNIHAVLGMMADKDIANAIKPLLKIVKHWYLGGLDITRAATPAQLQSFFPDDSNNINCFDNVREGYKLALDNSEPTDLILVFGSFFTVAEIRRQLV